MRVRADEIIQLLHFVFFQRLEDYLLFTKIASIDQHCGFGRRHDENRVSINWTDIEHVDL